MMPEKSRTGNFSGQLTKRWRPRGFRPVSGYGSPGAGVQSHRKNLADSV